MSLYDINRPLALESIKTLRGGVVSEAVGYVLWDEDGTLCVLEPERDPEGFQVVDFIDKTTVVSRTKEEDDE